MFPDCRSQQSEKPGNLALTASRRNWRIEIAKRSVDMGDIMSILGNSYASAALATPSNTLYANVDPTLYKGTWNGTYSNNQKFQISVSDVNGFRAQVKYQSGSTVQYQSVLIKDNSFRFGDTKFTLTAQGTADVRNVVTDPASGNTSLVEGTATLAT
jgi:hypothetical protein